MPARKDAKSSKCLGTSWSLGHLYSERGVNQKKDWMESGSSSWHIDFRVWCQNYVWCIISKTFVPNDIWCFFFPAPGSMVGPLTPSAIVFAHCATRRKRQPRRGPKQPVVPMKPRKEVRWCKIRCFCWGKKWKKSLTCHWFVCSHGTTQQNSIYSIQSLSLVISLFGLHLWLGCQDLAIEVDYARLCISRLHLERVFVLFNLQCSWM